jgi:hypothetical protein
MRFLLDENMNAEYRAQLLGRGPELSVWRVGDPGCPPTGTLDPEILRWCENAKCVLVTNNRKSMPQHLAEHLAAGRHVPGLLVLRRRAVMGEVLADLLLIAGTATEADLLDQIHYVPLL